MSAPGSLLQTRPFLERLDDLERLVAINCTSVEWSAFVQLLHEAGYNITPEGIRRV